MSSHQTMRQRRELHAVTAIGKQEPKTLMTGMEYGPKNDAESHGDVNNFLGRQIARGLVPKEKQ